MLDELNKKNWEYLVAAVQNERAAYVNARATRYARAIIAADRVIKSLDVQPVQQPEASCQ